MDPSYQGRIPQVPYNRPGGRLRFSPRMLLIGIIVIVVIIIGFVLLSASGDKSGPLQQHLTARMTTLDKMVAVGGTDIQSDDVRAFNARLRTQLMSDEQTLKGLMTQKTDTTITASEADKASFDSLTDAQLNSRFDSTYTKLIAQKLDSTTQLMKELYNSTNSKSLKQALGSAYQNYQQLEAQATALTNS